MSSPDQYNGICVGGPYAGRSLGHSQTRFEGVTAPRIEAFLGVRSKDETLAEPARWCYTYGELWGVPLWVFNSDRLTDQAAILRELLTGYHPAVP